MRPIDKGPGVPERILIIRTDRIGDTVLSTPVIESLRHAFPSAHIAWMTRGHVKDVIEHNPFLDEIIIYRKEVETSAVAFWKAASDLRRRHFDLALILHPVNSVHALAFAAGIPRRVGYDRKCPFLLTDRVEHAKQLGEKHEMEYVLDMVRYLGIDPVHHGLCVAPSPASEAWADAFLKEIDVRPKDKVLALHPGSSCRSKMWPQERFAAVADVLVRTHGFKVFLLGGPDEKEITGNVLRAMRSPAIDLTGVSVSHDISLIKRMHLFITTDSGPMHIAAALKVPLVGIFGRNQPGISPVRFGPVGTRHRVLHKDVGCSPCLAHDCVKGFACLAAVSADEVVAAANALLEEVHASG